MKATGSLPELLEKSPSGDVDGQMNAGASVTNGRVSIDHSNLEFRGREA